MTQVRLPPPQAWTFARLPILCHQLRLEPRTVLHIGAHAGEEVEIYRQLRLDPIRLVEPDPGQVTLLRDRFGHDPGIEIIPAAVTAGPAGRELLYRGERTVWNSLVPGAGPAVEVDTLTLPDLQGDAHILVLDTQGTEGHLLRTADLDHPDLLLVIVETSRRPSDSAAFYDDAVSYAAGRGWYVAEEWIHDGSGYTDTVFVRG